MKILEKPFWLKINSPQIKQFDLIIGWDSEYYNQDGLQKVNKIISYQFVGYQKKTSKYFEKIIYPVNKKTLPEIIKEIIEDLKLSRREIENKYQILLVAHYSLAEWSMLEKRHLLLSKLTEVYGTLTSFKPFKININYKERNNSIDILWQDTYFYTDEKNRALEKISSNCFNKKINIPKEYSIEKINILLKKNKTLFEEYAINDARIALEYYCNYMNDYYEMSEVEELPLTLGDSSVKWFLKHLERKSTKENKRNNKWYEEKVLGIEWTRGRKRQKNKDRWVDELFANNTYLGGINTSYYIGKFQSEDHWILDIDISNCYPTSLAVQPIIDWSKHSKKYVLYDILKEKACVINKAIDIGIFKIDNFEFHENIYQTAFPTPNEGGLIYYKSGKDIYTNYPEVVTAIGLGVNFKNNYPEEVRIFEELKDENGEPILAFADFLQLPMNKLKMNVELMF